MHDEFDLRTAVEVEQPTPPPYHGRTLRSPVSSVNAGLQASVLNSHQRSPSFLLVNLPPQVSAAVLEILCPASQKATRGGSTTSQKHRELA